VLTCLPLMFALELRAWVVIKRSIWHCIGIVPTMANTFLTSPLRSCPVHVLYCMQPNLHGNGSAVLTSDTSRHLRWAPFFSLHYIFLLCSSPYSLMDWSHIRCMHLPWAGASDIFLHLDVSSVLIALFLAPDSPYASLGCTTHIRCMRLPWTGAPDIFLHLDLSTVFCPHRSLTGDRFAV